MAAGEPELDLTLSIGGVPVGASLRAGQLQLEPDGEGAVVAWDQLVALSIEICCFHCQEAELAATMIDGAGREYHGEVTLLLARDECPDPTVCCVAAAICPAELEPQLCP